MDKTLDKLKARREIILAKQTEEQRKRTIANTAILPVLTKFMELRDILVQFDGRRATIGEIFNQNNDSLRYQPWRSWPFSVDMVPYFSAKPDMPFRVWVNHLMLEMAPEDAAQALEDWVAMAIPQEEETNNGVPF